MTVLSAFELPSDFERMSWMPTASTTARTAPPAITPVPGAAGRSSTSDAEKRPRDSKGMVVPSSGASITRFLASSTPLRIASGTSAAFPMPTPTWPA